MSRFVVLLLALCVSSAPIGAQATSAEGERRAAMLAEAQRAMEPFAWLIGEWEGTATVHMGNGGTFSIAQRETVTSAAFNTAMLIQGRGMSTVNAVSKLTWDAAGLFGYDAGRKVFSFASASGSGNMQMFAVTTQGDGFTWGFRDGAGMEQQYVIAKTPQGQWKEVGRMSIDGGKSWTTTVELLLSKTR